MKVLLNDRHALVCGGSQGIGLAAAQEMAALGATVTIAARNEQTMDESVQTLATDQGQSHHTLMLDLGDPEAAASAVRQFVEEHPVQILINNAGGPPAGMILQATMEQLQRAFAMHVLSSQEITRTVLPGMRSAGYGRIINIISTSVRQPIAGLGVSNTIRGAMASWSKTLANELAPEQITVNNILPGATRTGRLDEVIAGIAAKQGKSVDEVRNEWMSAIPMGRFADPREIGGVIAFLASPAAAYITGTSILVDGGRTGCL